MLLVLDGCLLGIVSRLLYDLVYLSGDTSFSLFYKRKYKFTRNSDVRLNETCAPVKKFSLVTSFLRFRGDGNKLNAIKYRVKLYGVIIFLK